VLIEGTDAAHSILASLHLHGREHDATEQDRARKMLNLDRDSGEFLYFLIRATRRRHILEIGTSNGYSAIWLAMALRDMRAPFPLITIDRDRNKLVQAAENIRAAGLDEFVELEHGEAADTVRTLNGPFDCVFFDADRLLAHHQLGALLPKLCPDCLLVADNAISHAIELRDYCTLVAELQGFTSLIVPIGKGLHVAHRLGNNV